ncbi:hypothetical protein AWZ03_009041 [Drosophila navojoa]|uniref:Uncharacterized protein n=1 Tax=Drosophila navojoa TaxID=7232 RepID=A0A484B6Q1_DRONA|nr:hypothetical protein AWZ03_009041 [Drosophila navojoa]
MQKQLADCRLLSQQQQQQDKQEKRQQQQEQQQQSLASATDQMLLTQQTKNLNAKQNMYLKQEQESEEYESESESESCLVAGGPRVQSMLTKCAQAEDVESKESSRKIKMLLPLELFPFCTT